MVKELCMMVHECSPNIGEPEAGGYRVWGYIVRPCLKEQQQQQKKSKDFKRISPKMINKYPNIQRVHEVMFNVISQWKKFTSKPQLETS
jgi:hypothetical protein